MTRKQIIDDLKIYFKIQELVCNHAFEKFGEKAWQFLDTDYLHALLILRRDVIGLPMECNNAKKKVFQRGLRCNRCEMVRKQKNVYLSAHCLGKAGDFTIIGMDAETARQRIKAHADDFPCKVRVEAGVSWLHFDVMDMGEAYPKVYEFHA
ncbi:MAG: hypothetical protein IJK44_03025 [Bacteroidales bacterium]|nr:hypothetical protein [Bacteroidales bacterium]